MGHLEIANNAIEGGMPLTRFTNSNSTASVAEDVANATDVAPEVAANLPNLTTFDLSGNKFSGSIPMEIGYFKSLTVLNLTGNTFSGSIPGSLGRLGGVLEVLDLSNN